MSRYIDAESLCEGRVGNDPVVIAANCEPTANVREIKYIKWKTTRNSNGWTLFECPNCGEARWRYDATIPNFCCNCGAESGTKKDNVIKSDCVYFYLEEDMGKSIPCCSKKSHRGICLCDTNNHYLDNCDGCDSYQKNEERLLFEQKALNTGRNR